MTSLTGAWTLIRFILRRDRIRIPIWVVAILATVVGTAAIFPDTYPTAADRQARATLVENPAMRLLLGPVHGTEDYTFGAMMATEMLGMMLVVVGLMSIFMVVRHTRAEEETGRAELVRSSVVGRHAAMSASLTVVVALNILIGLLVAIALNATLVELDLTGSLMFGAAMASFGIFFAAITLVSVQINEFARAASGMAIAFLIGTYVVRGFGDMLENPLEWMPPSGLALQSAPYVDNAIWPLSVLVGLSVALVPLAFVLSDRRDVAAGLRQPRPGPAHASPLLARPFGMVIRRQRGALMAWGIGLILFGLAYGSMINEIGEQYGDNPMVQDYFAALGLDTQQLTESVIAMVVMFMALLASLFTVSTITRLRSDETSNLAENLLATAVSRIRWAGETLIYGIVMSTVILLLTGLGGGLMFALDTGNWGDMWTFTGAILAYAPALWLAAAVAVAVLGLFPKAMLLAWFVPVYGFFALMLAPMMGLPGWINDLSPFEYIPRIPSVDFDAVPLIVMSLIALGLIVAGLFGIRRRDMEFV
jgi:ABC-2 type transport system permease protein